MNSTLNLALKKVSRELSVDYDEVESVYKSYWSFIRNTIEKNSLYGVTKEEFDANKVNFNIPYIGKLFADYDKLIKYNKSLKYYQNVKRKRD